MRRLGTCLASTNREALGFRPALKKGSATVIWPDGDRRAARKRRAQGPYGVCQVPGRTDQGFKTPRWSVERRILLLPRRVVRRSISPQKGRSTKSLNSHGGARTRSRGCLKFESEAMKRTSTQH